MEPVQRLGMFLFLFFLGKICSKKQRNFWERHIPGGTFEMMMMMMMMMMTLPFGWDRSYSSLEGIVFNPLCESETRLGHLRTISISSILSKRDMRSST